MKRLSAVFLLLLCCLYKQGLAQPSPYVLLKEADEDFSYGAYVIALPKYLQLQRQAKQLGIDEQIRISFRLGLCYLNSNQKANALTYLKQVWEQDPNYHPDLAFHLAEAYQYNHRFSEAIQYYQSYLEKNTQNRTQRAALAKKKIEECQNGLYFMAAPAIVDIQNVGAVVNSEYPEYVPLVTVDESELIFTSRRPHGKKDHKTDPTDGLFYENVYVSRREGGVWQPPEPLLGFNNKKSHTACIAISPDGQQLFLYKPGKKGLGDIFVSHRRADGSWSKALSLGKHINTPYRETSVSISSDGRRLYFSSDRPGGYGGLDLYYSQKQADGSWGPPINLGPTINTPYHEDAPFIYRDSILYFSSQGHTSMGGFDIFFSRFTADNKQWSKPINLGYPINTADDDIYFVIAAGSQNAYYASDRMDSFGDKDIYVIRTFNLEAVEPIAHLAETKPNQSISLQRADVNNPNTSNQFVVLKGRVSNTYGRPVPAKIQLYDVEQSYIEEEIYLDTTDTSFEIVLRANRVYDLQVEHEDYLLFYDKINLTQIAPGQMLEYPVVMQPLVQGGKLKSTIFFEYNKASLDSVFVNQLEYVRRLMIRYENIFLEIAGHTDAVGSATRNNRLAEQRAQVVANALIRMGVPANRLIVKGYGYTQPIAPNTTEQGRQLNRRVEFIVVLP